MYIDILSRESLNLSEQDEVAFQELKRGGEIEEIKFQIFERLTCGKWISFCLLVTTTIYIYIYIDLLSISTLSLFLFPPSSRPSFKRGRSGI